MVGILLCYWGRPIFRGCVKPPEGSFREGSFPKWILLLEGLKYRKQFLDLDEAEALEKLLPPVPPCFLSKNRVNVMR